MNATNNRALVRAGNLCSVLVKNKPNVFSRCLCLKSQWRVNVVEYMVFLFIDM